MRFAIVILLAAMSQKGRPDGSQLTGKEFLLIRQSGPMINTIAACDDKVVFGKLSKTIREIFPKECEVKAADRPD